jgi:hypothetical protein
MSMDADKEHLPLPMHGSPALFLYLRIKPGLMS